ncbi:hypothetical protein HYQ45_000764 [Verticillium longisporum]|uniref:Uncharacterized protein n=1 Tax=Verticillium longisporum TaxID=100787 RepID=A0A8I3AYP9_VERLO|nr:hypothetical protein HYQ45_000764 [Verticillium longisporum]
MRVGILLSIQGVVTKLDADASFGGEELVLAYHLFALRVLEERGTKTVPRLPIDMHDEIPWVICVGEGLQVDDDGVVAFRRQRGCRATVWFVAINQDDANVDRAFARTNITSDIFLGTYDGDQTIETSEERLGCFPIEHLGPP